MAILCEAIHILENVAKSRELPFLVDEYEEW